MILTVGGIKGGCGKSMLSTNLVVIRALKGKKILFIDADDQGTSDDWTAQRTGLGISTPWTTIRLKGSAVRTEVRKLIEHYDDIVIDCGGRDTGSLRAALIVSDVFLIPFQPKSFDIWTVNKVSEIVDEALTVNERLKAMTIINCASSRGNDNKDSQDILSELPNIKLIPKTIGLRKAFSNAAAEGLGIVETKSDSKAEEEMLDLYNYIFNTKLKSK